MRVKFIRVGRANQSWSAEVDAVTEEWLYQQVKRKGAVASVDVHFGDEGEIFAGITQVGSFQVEE